MSQDAYVNLVFNAAASGTQYAPPVTSGVPYFGFNIPNQSDIGLTIQHPTGTTTVYSLEVSNTTADEVKAGVDDWTPYTASSLGTGVSKAAAEDFAIELIQLPFARARLKMVTSAGSGVIQVRACTKSRG
jgi:hypothetical protein